MAAPYKRLPDKMYEHQVNAGIDHKGSGLVVHHLDNNGLNNDPDNLVVMTQSEHARLHATGRTVTPETRERIREAVSTSSSLSARSEGGKKGGKWSPGKGNAHNRKREITSEMVANLYNSGLTQREVARELGVSQRLVQVRLKEMELAVTEEQG